MSKWHSKDTKPRPQKIHVRQKAQKMLVRLQAQQVIYVYNTPKKTFSQYDDRSTKNTNEK